MRASKRSPLRRLRLQCDESSRRVSSMPVSKCANFRGAPVSRTIRHRLGSIDESRGRSPNQKMALVDKLLDSSHDRARGLYVPLSSHVFLPAKLTQNFA